MLRLLQDLSYSNLDPQCPTGGPDGTKDILCEKDARKLVVGCYFPNGQRPISDITEKFSHDYEGMTKNAADGFLFVTNQKITPTERLTLSASFPTSEIYHGERVCGALDSPKGYGIRLEYLGVELTKAEQISFLNSYLDLEENFEEIKAAIDVIKRSTVEKSGVFESRDVSGYEKLSVLPISGVPHSSRLSVEDLQALHLACLYETSAVSGFRKTQVWIGGPTVEDANYVPPPPNEVSRRVNELLDWWRKDYMNVLHADTQAKILAIAQFHERFLSIHPFLDGTWRLARVLASIQYRDLLGRHIVFEEFENIQEYHAALQLARQGGHQALVDIFLSLAK